MTVSDEDRRDLFEGFAALLDRKRANTLMELLPPVGWSDVARRGDIAELRGEIAELRADIRSQLADLRISMMRTLLASVIGLAGLFLGVVSLAG